MVHVMSAVNPLAFIFLALHRKQIFNVAVEHVSKLNAHGHGNIL